MKRNLNTAVQGGKHMAEVNKYLNFINGVWCEPVGGEYYPNFNPADSRDNLGSFPLSDSLDAERAVESAAKAFGSWKRLDSSQREQYLLRFLELLGHNRERIGEIVCRESGKILKEALAEPDRGAAEIRFMIGEGKRLEGITQKSDRFGVVSVAERVPLGVVVAITPWNFPFLTPLRKVIPALVMGNTVVLKPASDAPFSGVILAELFEKAGLPAGVFNLVMGSGKTVGDALSLHPKVAGISFTGSTGVGRSINRNGGEHFAKIQLEMGGKNPALVFDCNNLEEAASQITSSACGLSGQRCTAISRVIVDTDNAAAMERLIAENMKKYVLGNGLEAQVTLGPIISRSAGEKIMQYLKEAAAAGARIAAGGNELTGGAFAHGCFIEPTLLAEVTPDMAVAREEIFGPVLALIKVDSFEEAIEVANATEYGLSASLFSDSLPLIYRFQQEVESGMTHVNHGTVTDGTMPFGGVKNSGLGSFSKGRTNRDFFTNFKVNYTKFV